MKRLCVLVWPLLIGVLCFPSAISAVRCEETVEAGGRYLGLAIGGGNSSFRDNLLIPLGFDGPGFLLGGIYTSESGRNIFQLRLKFDIGFLHNRYDHEAYAAGAEFRGSWLRTLTRNWRYGDVWGGACFQLKMTNWFIDSWDESHLYWLTAHSVGAAVEWRKMIAPKKTVIMHIEFPLVSCISRPPEYRYHKQDALNHWTYHLVEPNRRLKLATPKTYRALVIQMLFRRTVRRSLLNLGLEFRYDQCRTPQNITGLHTTVILAYQWRIG